MRQLRPYVLRLCKWPALTIGITLAWSVTWWRAGDSINEVAALWVLRIAGVLVVVAAAFVWDDPAFDLTQSASGARRLLLPVRVAVATVTVLLGFLPAMFAVWRYIDAAVIWGVALELGVVFVVLSGVALWLQSTWRLLEPAQYLVLLIVAIGVYEQATLGRWPLLAGPGPEWQAAHARWAVVGLAGVALLAWQLRDPAARPIRRVVALPGAGVTSRGEHPTPRDRSVR